MRSGVVRRTPSTIATSAARAGSPATSRNRAALGVVSSRWRGATTPRIRCRTARCRSCSRRSARRSWFTGRNGEIKWQGGLVYISEALAGELIGLDTEADDIAILLGHLRLGAIDENRRFDRTLLDP